MVAFRIEEADPSFAVVASFLAIRIHPSFVVVSRILVVHIVVVASVDRINQVATSCLVVGSPSVVGHILAVASLVSPSFQVVDHTSVAWATAEVDSRVATFLPSLVIAYLATSSVAEACRPS
jgi:hypothetical protein